MIKIYELFIFFVIGDVFLCGFLRTVFLWFKVCVKSSKS